LCAAPLAHAHTPDPLLDCAADGSSADFARTLWSINPLTRRIATTTGCPNHVFYSTNGDAVPKQVASSELLNAYPQLQNEAGRTTNLSMVAGPVGMMINGVAVYSSYAEERAATTYGASATKLYAGDIDLCGGSTDQYGVYHYHNTPGCLQEQAMKANNLTLDDHSPVLGWAFDGFPIYGQLGPGGVEMLMCNSTGADETFCLDECGGYEGNITGVDAFLYRYYMTCGFDEAYFPFTINCRCCSCSWCCFRPRCCRRCCRIFVENRCHSSVEDCYSSIGPLDGFTDDYDPFYPLPAAYIDTDLIDGDDLDQIDIKDSMDCSFYMGSADPNPPPAPTPTPTAAPPFEDGSGDDG
ncbi:unnamed protein product, partial [Scytosiphon promiscuus]